MANKIKEVHMSIEINLSAETGLPWLPGVSSDGCKTHSVVQDDDGDRIAVAAFEQMLHFLQTKTDGCVSYVLAALVQRFNGEFSEEMRSHREMVSAAKRVLDGEQ